MSRRGYFGRLPRAAPSLTSTIVGLAREFQAARDKNITDAWKNGGMFEGQPVTDELFLAHWRERLSQVSPKDPLWDQYNNLVNQVEYTIAESKQRTLYAQGKITDQQMAQFYLDWAKKVPENSEFYRQLQRDAAQFMERTKAAARGGSARASADSLAKAGQAVYDKYEAAGALLSDALLKVAQAAGILGKDEDFTDLNFQQRAGGPAAMVTLIGALNRNQAFLDLLKKVDPTFTGTVTFDYYQQMVNRQLQGLQIRYQQAVKAGQKTVANDIAKNITGIQEGMGQASMWDTAQSYMAARRSFLSVWEDPTATPIEKKAAFDAYAKTLTKLANDPNNPVDDVTRAMLEGEANLDPNIDSWWENWSGLKDLQPSQSGGKAGGDIADTKAFYDRFTSEIEEASSPNSGVVWTYGTRDKDGNFTASRITPGSIPAIGVADAQQVMAQGGKLIFIPQGTGVDPMPLYVQPGQVTMSANLPGTKPGGFDAAGNPVPVTNFAGQVLDFMVGGKVVRLYGYKDGNGIQRWSPVQPWADGVVEKNNRDGSVTLDVTAIAASVIKTDADGKQTWDPRDVISRSRQLAGVNSATDFVSPTMAALVAAGTDGRMMLLSAGENSPLRRQLEADMLQQLSTFDATTGAYRLNAQAWNAFTQQLDTYSGVPVSLPVFNREGRESAVQLVGQQDELTPAPGTGDYTQTVGTSPFAPLVGFVVPGWNPQGAGSQVGDVSVTQPAGLKLPLMPDLRTDQQILGIGQEEDLNQYASVSYFQQPAPISQEVTSTPFVPTIEYQAPTPVTSQYQDYWTSPSGTGAEDYSLPQVAPTPPAPPTGDFSDPMYSDPNYWLGLGY